MNIQVDPQLAASAGSPVSGPQDGPSRGGRRLSRSALLASLFLAGLGLCAASQPRDILWHVEQSCLLNHRWTGSSFPCLEIDQARGVAVLRPPLRHSHVVAMPIVPIPGIEAPELRAGDGPNYFEAAWDERRFVQAGLRRPLPWNGFGLAVNSKLTRSQDQLHIHIDCVKKRVRQALSQRFGSLSSDAWQPAAYLFQRQSYWVRRLHGPSLAGVNIFALAHEIPELQDNPAMTVIAVVGFSDPTGDGFLVLAGQSDPAHGASQSTSEDLLDHSCAGAE